MWAHLKYALAPWQSCYFRMGYIQPPCSSILPTVLPIFTYDYKAKNERQEARGKSLFINAEYIQANVITC